MNSIHNKSPMGISVDLAIFHRIDINLYPLLFIAIYEQKVFQKRRPKFYVLANPQPVMHYNV